LVDKEKGETDNKPKKLFYSPEITLIQVCHKCRACVYKCPVDAIVFGVGELIVNRNKCAEYIFSREDHECIECAAECHTGALSLQLFELKEDGEVIKIED
jgi:ferredoxin